MSRCIVCNSTLHGEVLEVTDWFLSKEKYDVVSCGECGFRYTAEPPDEDEIGLYYKSEDYISHSDIKSGITSRLYHIVRNYMLSRKRRLIGNSTRLSKGSLLDIGCGTGYFPGYMKRSGWDVTGIEKDIRAALYANEMFGVSVLPPAEIENIETGSMDVVTMWHVLEHIADPEAVLKQIERVLVQGGLAVIALPNCRSWDARHYGSYWAAWDVPRHLWHFSEQTFSRFAENSGFKVVKSIRMPFDGFYVSILSSRYKGTPAALIVGLTAGLYGWIASLLRKNNSSSLIYILKTKN